MLYAARYGTIDSTAGSGYELQVIAAVVVGGVAIFGGSGSVVGAAFGALLLQTILSALYVLGVSPFWNQAIAGALLLGAIALDRGISLKLASMLRKTEDPPWRLSSHSALHDARPLGDRPRRRARGGHRRSASSSSSQFLTAANLFYLNLSIGEVAIMTLPMTLIIITGEIDLSVASILGMSSALLGDLVSPRLVGAGSRWWSSSSPARSPARSTASSITRVGLPSLAVTIGTLTLYRGIAIVILGLQTISTFPARYTNIGVNAVPAHRRLPLVLGRVLHRPRDRLRRRPARDTRSGARCSSWARTRRPRATPASASSGRS